MLKTDAKLKSDAIRLEERKVKALEAIANHLANISASVHTSTVLEAISPLKKS